MKDERKTNVLLMELSSLRELNLVLYVADTGPAPSPKSMGISKSIYLGADPYDDMQSRLYNLGKSYYIILENKEVLGEGSSLDP